MGYWQTGNKEGLGRGGEGGGSPTLDFQAENISSELVKINNERYMLD